MKNNISVENRDHLNYKWSYYYFILIGINLVVTPIVAYLYFSYFHIPLPNVDKEPLAFMFVPVSIMGNALIFLSIALGVQFLSFLAGKKLFAKFNPDVKNYNNFL